MKAMIRALVDETDDDWDHLVPWLLFAYREVLLETLGFSLFELLFS